MVAAFTYIEGDTAQSGLPFDLISTLAKVHSYSVKTQPMDISQELFFYEQSAVYKQYQQQIKLALKTVTSIPINEGFCHNDLVKENIIENVSGSYLIDFEYAKTNDVYFDLAALIVAFKLNEHDQQTLLAQYENCSLAGSDFTSSTIKLNCYRLFFLVLCVGWYEQRDINNKTIELRAQLDELTNLNFG
jgi:thiamine kinase-like enzyme